MKNQARLSAILAATTALASPAIAQDSFTLAGELTAVDPTFDRPDFDTCCPGAGNNATFDAIQVTITDAASYVFEITSAAFDSYINLHSAAFDATNPDASYVVGDDDDGGPGFLSRLDGTNDVVPNGQYVLTVSTYADGELGNYTLSGSGAVLGFSFANVGPSEFAGTTSGTTRMLVADAGGIAREQGQASLVARDQRLSFTRVTGEDGAPVVTVSHQDSSDFIGNLRPWVELTGFYASDDTADVSLRGYGLQIGADTEIAPDLVVGLSLGASDIDASNAGTAIDGTVIYVQPYLAYSNGPWSGSASILYGQGDFEQSGVGGDGTGDTTLAAIDLTGGYDVALQPGLTVTPTVGLLYGVEEVEGTGGALTGESEVTFSQASIGARLTHDYAGGVAFAGLHIDYGDADSDTVLADDIVINQGATGRIEVGGSWALANGFDLDAGLEIGGLGGDLNETSAALRINFNF